MEMKSMPELNFGLSWSQIFNISVSEILENLKSVWLFSDRNVSKETFETPISDAYFGPIWEKKLLKPFAISM